jgi:hypothetical protein
MRSVITFSSLLTLVLAAPTLDRRQTKTSNDVTNGVCAGTTFIMARGSTEQGNMVREKCVAQRAFHNAKFLQGTIVGSQLCAAMKTAGDVACQGVGGAYKATLAANTQPKGTDDASIQQAVSLIMQAMTQCPNSKMVLAGYRQVYLPHYSTSTNTVVITAKVPLLFLKQSRPYHQPCKLKLQVLPSTDTPKISRQMVCFPAIHKLRPRSSAATMMESAVDS